MNIKKIYYIGTVFTIILGFLFHFLYEWTNYNDIVGLFTAINESTWEHLKLLFFPYFLFSIIEYYYYGKNHSNFICSKFISVLLGMSLIVIIFYTYTGILGTHFVIIDILIFIICTIITYIKSYNILMSDKYCSKNCNILCLIGVMLFIALFFTFTFNPPHLKLFLDPTTNSYGTHYT